MAAITATEVKTMEEKAREAARLSGGLLRVKLAVESKLYPEREKELLCDLFDQVFMLGFVAGVGGRATDLLEKAP